MEDMAMDRFDFSPLFRSTIGFDRLARLVDTATAGDRAEAATGDGAEAGGLTARPAPFGNAPGSGGVFFCRGNLTGCSLRPGRCSGTMIGISGDADQKRVGNKRFLTASQLNL